MSRSREQPRAVCPVCQRTFTTRAALRDHRKAKGHLATSGDTPLWRRHAGALALALAAAGLLAWLTFADEGPRYPVVGSHWHARYAISICGGELPPRPYSEGDIHTHGAGLIHIHPSSRRSAGRAADLGRFFRSFGGRLEDSLLRVPGVGTYRTGTNSCGPSPGRVPVYVDGDRVEDPGGYVPRDGQSVRIVFEPESAAAAATLPVRAARPGLPPHPRKGPARAGEVRPQRAVDP